MPAASTVEVQYWDSCLFICLLVNNEPTKVKIITDLVRQAEAGGLRIVISNLVLAEVRPSTGYDNVHQLTVENLLEANRPYVQPFAVTRSIANLSREVGANFPKLTVPDSIHIATALVAKADVFYTYDGAKDNTRRRSGDLLRYDGQIIDSSGRPLSIKAPVVTVGPLFDSVAT